MCSAIARTLGSPKTAARSPPLLEAAEQSEDRRRVGLLALGGNLREDLLDGAQLLRLVVDDEVALVAELLDVLAQDADAEGVEGADGGSASRVEA